MSENTGIKRVTDPTTLSVNLPNDQGTPNFMINDPSTGQQEVVQKPSVGINSSSRGKLQNMWTDLAIAPKPTVDVARKGQVQTFSADIDHAKYERYYAHPEFKQLGFSPFRDNEKFYNDNTSGWSDFRRTFAQWGSLAGTGFKDAMSFGPSSDRSAARDFEKAMAIGQSTRGGVGGFASNLFLNSGYTFGIIAEMLVEEALLFGATVLTGGATSGTMAASLASKGRLLDKGFDLTKAAVQGERVVDALDDLNDINKARSYWQRVSGKAGDAAGALAGRLMPATGDLIKNWDNMKDLSSLAKASTSGASFYKDIRNIRLAYGESALEAGMVENELLDELYHEAMLKNNGEPVTAEQMGDLRKRAKDASMVTFGMNFPTIWLSNAIVFDNMFNSFSPIKTVLNEPVKKNIAGQLVKEVGRKATPYQIVDSNFKGMLKSFTKPKTYAKYGLNYFRANFAEGAQESIQEVISGATKDYYRQDPNNPIRQGFYDMISRNVSKQVSPEGFEVFASGFLMGGPVNMVTTVGGSAIEQVKKFRDPNYTQKRAAAMEELVKEQTIRNEVYDDPFKYYDINLENAVTQTAYQEAMDNSKNDGDAKAFYDSAHAAETSHVLTILQSGQMDSMVQRMEDFSKMTPEEIKENFPNMENPEQYREKMDKIIARAKTLEADYKFIKNRFPAPPNPNSVSSNDPDSRRVADYNYIAWQNSVNQLLFMRSSFANNAKRQNSIIQEAQQELTGTNINGADYVSLFDSPSGPGQQSTTLNDLIRQKMQSIENLQVLDDATATPQSIELRDSEAAKLKTLMDYKAALMELNGLSNTAPDDVRLDVENKFKQAYSEVLTTLNGGQELLVDQVESSLEKLIDYTKLNAESIQVKAAVNYLMNPDNFTIHFSRNYDAVQMGHENRKAFLDEALKLYMDKMINNELLKLLFNEAGVFLTPGDVERLTKGSLFPQKMYYTTNEKAEVAKTSSTWKKASSIINDYLKNVKDKPIPEADSESEYSVRTRNKLEGDNRTYEDLSKQYDFELDKPTRVNARKVLQKITESEFATEAEKELARKLIPTMDDSDYIEFENTLAQPGFYSMSSQTHIDARYNSSDYKNGNQPIEVVILHEEIHRKTVEGLNKDPEFKAKMQELMDTVIASPEFKLFTKETKLPPYGTKNLAEFVAETMSNPVFQDLLSKIQAKGDVQKSTWAAFVDAVVEFLGNVLASNSVGTLLSVKRVEGSVLNAAFDVITTNIDSRFGGKAAEVESGIKITAQTPVGNMPASLKQDLLYKFKEVNSGLDEIGRNPIMANWKELTDEEILNSSAFQQWVKNNPPGVTAAITKYNSLSEVKEEVKEPVKNPLRYSGNNPTSTTLITRMVDGELQVLMIKRADTAVEGGKWALPGGFVDTDAKKGNKWKPGKETPLEAAKREVAEETGMDITELDDKQFKKVGTYKKDVNKDPRNTNTSWVLSYVFSVDVPMEMGDGVSGQDDAQDAKWFNVTELEAMAPSDIAFNHADILIEEKLKTPVAEAQIEKEKKVILSDREIEKQERLKPLIERREQVQKELDELRELLEEPSEEEQASFNEAKKAAEAMKKGFKSTEAEGYAYFDYPELSYEQGLANVISAVDNFTPGQDYSIEELEEILKKLNVNEFTMNEFMKIKSVLKANGVNLRATEGQETNLGTYGEFKIKDNRVILNLSTLLMDPKVEKPEQIAQIIVHEMIHAAVVYKTYRSLYPERFQGTGELTDLEKTAVDNLKYAYSELLKIYGMREEYGITSVDEMLAELSNPQFVEKLKSFKINNLKVKEAGQAKNMFELIIDAIVKLVSGVGIKSPAYDVIYNAYETLISNDSLPQKAAFEAKVKDKFEEVGKGNTVSRKDALNYRNIEFPLIMKEKGIAGKFKRLIAASAREARMADPNGYTGYNTLSNLNIDQIVKKIADLEMELASLDAQISAIEDEYTAPSEEQTPFLSVAQRDKLTELGYSPAMIRGMSMVEANVRINSGLTFEQYETGIEEEMRELDENLDKERRAIRGKLNDLLESAQTYEEFQIANEYARDILSSTMLREVSGFDAEEITNLLDNRRRELSELVVFDNLEVGNVVLKTKNPDSKFIVVKKTGKQIQIRKFGDPMAKIEKINKQDIGNRIKYMYNQFMEEVSTQVVKPTAEEQEIMKKDSETVKSISDNETIQEDLEKAKTLTEDQAEEDFFSNIKDNCK
jgi:ADP-ribose pyrophosphatase YjhB (NUDIX family)